MTEDNIVVHPEIQETNISQNSWVDIVNTRWAAYHGSVIKFGEMSLKGVFLLNGISSISLLSFLGAFLTTFTASTVSALESFSCSLEYFAFGTLSAVIGVIAAYFGEGMMWKQFESSRPLHQINQEQYDESVRELAALEKIQMILAIFTIILLLISIILFICGVSNFTNGIELYKNSLVG